MAPFGTKAVNLIVILASVLEISDAVNIPNPAPKILLDVGSAVPRDFVVRALAGNFVSKSPIWIQLWKDTAFGDRQIGNYTLIWQVEVNAHFGDGGLEVVQLGEKNYKYIRSKGIHLAVYSVVRPSALSAIFNPSVGNLHLSNAEHCQRHVKHVLSVNVSCMFDTLRWPYALPLRLCNSFDCSDLSIERRWPTDVAGSSTSASTSTTPETATEKRLGSDEHSKLNIQNTTELEVALQNTTSTTPETATAERQGSDENSESIKVTHEERGEMTSSRDLRNTVIGLIIWNVILSVVLLIVAASVVVAHTNISYIKRINSHNSGIYVVNKPTKHTERNDRRERNGRNQQELGLSAI